MGVNTSFQDHLIPVYRRYERLLDSLRSPLLLAVRLTWGGLFVQAGWGKWHNIPKVIGFFTELGIPLPVLNAYVVATTELVGGALLLLGLFGRLAPVPLIIAMLVAYASSEQEALQELTQGNLDPVLTAAPFLFLLASTLVLIFGPGLFSLDALLARKLGLSRRAGTPR